MREARLSDRERQLEAFERNKRKADTGKASSAKRDWLPVTFSVASLIVSLTTLYFNIFLQEDNLRVVIGETPMVSRNEGGEIGLYGDQQLTFINSGNRPAALTRIEAHARALQDEADRECKKPDDVRNFFAMVPINFDAKPFVIRPGEIQHVTTTPEAGLAWRKEKAEGGTREDETPMFRLPREYHQSKGSGKYLVCITLSFVVPDNYAVRWQKAAYLFSFDGADAYFADRAALFDEGKPIVILSGRKMRWNFW
jgi:hypothetical protein